MVNIDKTQIVSRMRQLIQLLAKHNHAYYVMDEPTISDHEYDQLFHQLKDLETAYPLYTARYTHATCRWRSIK